MGSTPIPGFSENIPVYVIDNILISNVFKAIKRGLKNHLDNLSYSNDVTFRIFHKPLVKTYTHYVALMHFYQVKNESSLREDYSTTLNKVAPPKLVYAFETFFSKVVTEARKWYMSESKNFKNEISNKKLWIFE